MKEAGRLFLKAFLYLSFFTVFAAIALSQAHALSYDEMLKAGHEKASLGHYRQAEQDYRQAYEIAQKNRAGDGEKRAESLLYMALMASHDHRFADAETLFQQADRILETTPLPDKHAQLLSYYAIHKANTGAFEAAYRLAQRSTEKRKQRLKTTSLKRENRDHRLTELAQSLFVEANIAAKLKKFGDAKLRAKLARRIVVEVETAPQSWMAHIDQFLADLDGQKGNFSKAGGKRIPELLTKE